MAEDPRDESHDDIDPQTGQLTVDAAARRRSIMDRLGGPGGVQDASAEAFTDETWPKPDPPWLTTPWPIRHNLADR